MLKGFVFLNLIVMLVGVSSTVNAGTNADCIWTYWKTEKQGDYDVVTHYKTNYACPSSYKKTSKRLGVTNYYGPAVLSPPKPAPSSSPSPSPVMPKDCPWVYSHQEVLGNYDILTYYTSPGPCTHSLRKHSHRFNRFEYSGPSIGM